MVVASVSQRRIRHSEVLSGFHYRVLWRLLEMAAQNTGEQKHEIHSLCREICGVPIVEIKCTPMKSFGAVSGPPSIANSVR